MFDGVAIYNALRNHKAKVTAQVDGIAASAASFVAMAADRIVMPSNSFMLVHQAAGFSMGTADDMKAVAADLERIDQSITATYAARTGQTTAKVRALMKEDRLMDAKEAKELGFADEVTKPVKLNATFKSFNLLPKAAAARWRAETGVAQGEPPQPDTASEGSGGQPVVLPIPTVAQSNVVDISTAKREGADEHHTYVTSITDLCTLARAPERIGGYLRGKTPVEQVRKELLEAQASSTVMPHHPLLPAAADAAASWAKITAKLNARRK